MSVTVSLRDEVTELLQDLIRVDTTNPPGNETAAAEVLRDGAERELILCAARAAQSEPAKS